LSTIIDRWEENAVDKRKNCQEFPKNDGYLSYNGKIEEKEDTDDWWLIIHSKVG